MKVSFTLKSGNAKTGPIPVSMTEAASCPNSYPFKGNGCYAENWPLRLHWQRVPQTGLDWGEFIDRVRALPAGQLWRHNAAGDLPGKGETIDGAALLELVTANTGKRGFTYTHKSPRIKANAVRIKKANDLGFTINLSANTLEEADEFVDLRIAPVVVTLPADYDHGTGLKTLDTPKNRRVVICPATYRDDVTCASCGLCQFRAPERVGGLSQRAIVGFPAHGARKKRASVVAAGDA